MVRRNNEIRRVSDLPEWFDLKKYAGAEKLDAVGWCEQLTVRRHCALILMSGLGGPGEAFAKALGMVRRQPIVDVLSDETLELYFLGGPLTEVKLRTGKPHYALAVHPMTVRQLCIVEEAVTPERREYFRKWWEASIALRNSRSKTREHYPYQEWLDSDICESSVKSSRRPLMVNLDLPDAVLIDSFKQWLDAARQNPENSPRVKPPRKQEFGSWAACGLLPFLDLRLWEIEAGVAIPNRVMADAIYPPGEGGEEAVRKTTKPLADRLMGKHGDSMRTIQLLAAQAAHEAIKAE